MAKQPKPEASTQAYLPISEIKEGIVALNDKSLRSVIIVSSLNFALKSEDEKNAIVTSYQDFLNSLNFPIQILATSRKIDLSNYMKTITDAYNKQTSPQIRLQIEEYQNFLHELLEYSNIMEKRFYVVVPYYPTGVDQAASLSIPNPLKKNNAPTTPFEEQKKQLTQRVEEIISGLTGIGLRCVALGTEDLLELFYAAYNPDTAPNQRVGGVQDVDLPLISANGNPSSDLPPQNIQPGGQNGTV